MTLARLAQLALAKTSLLDYDIYDNGTRGHHRSDASECSRARRVALRPPRQAISCLRAFRRGSS